MDSLNSNTDWINIISNFGFPIAMTLYLFIRFEKKIEKLEIAINELISVIKSWGGK